MPKEKYESPNPRRAHTLMSPEDVAAGKKSTWFELEITGEAIFTSSCIYSLIIETIRLTSEEMVVEPIPAFKVALWDRDVKPMCSLRKCKQ